MPSNIWKDSHRNRVSFRKQKQTPDRLLLATAAAAEGEDDGNFPADARPLPRHLPLQEKEAFLTPHTH